MEVFSSLLILMFIYTAASKLMDIKSFIGSINNQPFDNRFTPYLVIGLPASEIIVSVLLAFARTRKAGFWMSTIMMTVFTGYISLVLAGVYDRRPCSCGGVFNNVTWPQHLFINIGFLIISLWGLVLSWKRMNN
ncbi:MauE/DoxX family redox-associated membrane protein [Chitinophaga sedimenti]|uniref:MauE/DoxX family redox-associated membrane protein n=1 Tax=Chitinophaga sedimenti TaxID=2033606 RepID=UPI0035588631